MYALSQISGFNISGCKQEICAPLSTKADRVLPPVFIDTKWPLSFDEKMGSAVILLIRGSDAQISGAITVLFVFDIIILFTTFTSLLSVLQSSISKLPY